MGFYLLDNPNPYTPQWVYPRRGARGKLSGTCIVHTAENMIDHVGPDAGAEGVANFIRVRADYGCYHTLVDSDSIMELVPYEYETWQDSETNNWAVGISAAIRAGEWLTIEAGRRDRIYRNLAWAAADFVKYMRDAYKIAVPFRRITGAQARAGVPGFCAHGDSGISRSDPGVQFEWAKFFRYAAEELKKMDGAQPAPTPPKETTMTVKPIEEQVVPVGGVRLGKDKLWYLKDRDLKTNSDFANGGGGFMTGSLFISGAGLAAGKELTVQFFVVTGTRRSGYYTQTIMGAADGTFKGHVNIDQSIPKGSRLECAVVSNDEATILQVWGTKAALLS
jgi:hypothetical protein